MSAKLTEVAFVHPRGQSSVPILTTPNLCARLSERIRVGKSDVFWRRSRSRKNTAVYLTPILSLNLVQKLGGSHSIQLQMKDE